MTEQHAVWSDIHIVSSNNGEFQLLIDLLNNAGYELESSCAGNGTCGKCRVRIFSGECLSPIHEEMDLLSAQDFEQGIRLACHCRVRGDVSLQIEKAANNIKVLESGAHTKFCLEPTIRKILLPPIANIQELSLMEQIYKDLLVDSAGSTRIILLQRLAANLSGDLTAILADNRLIGLESGDTTAYVYGVAVDVGTTTVVASLHSLVDGHKAAVVSALNPQTQYGLDVLSRIQYAANGNPNLERLNELIVDCLNGLISDLCRQSGVDKRHIYRITVAANTVMLHLLLGVSPVSIGRAPYHPVFRQGQVLAAGDIGIKASHFAYIFCLPSISGFVGADIVAGIMAADLHGLDGTVLFLDLGTNGEIVLGREGKLLSCSTAAGPALEGMNISCGMRAADGAIEDVWMEGSFIKWRTIGDGPPLGLCGSGLLDLTAIMLESGLINAAGRIAAKEKYIRSNPNLHLAQGIEELSGKRRYCLYRADLAKSGREVYISQADIRQVQLAKSAIVAGIKVLMARFGLNENEISQVFVAGAFGAYLKPESLVRLGFFPDNWRDRITFVGNTSQAGAVMALLSGRCQSRMEDIAQNVEYIELESYPGFEKMFVDNMSFPVQKRPV